MRKLKILFGWASLISVGTIQAQGTGEPAVQSVKTAKTNNWQNWAFAGSMLLTAAGAIFFVAANNGNASSDNSH